jgi:hypothetical protein
MSEQFLQDYFIKYNLDYTKIKYKPKKLLSTDLSIYSIESSKHANGDVIINNNTNNILGSIEVFPLFQLLHVIVNISTWNEYIKGEKEWSEEEIIKVIFKILKNS